MDATEAIKTMRQLYQSMPYAPFLEVVACMEALVKANREMRHSLIGEGWTEPQLITAWGPAPILPV